MISWENNLSSYEQNSVVATFTLQLKSLAQHSPDVSNLMMMLSFFDPENIPLQMLITGADILVQRLSELGNPTSFASHIKVVSLTRTPKKTLAQTVTKRWRQLRSSISTHTHIAPSSTASQGAWTRSPPAEFAPLRSLIALIKSPVRLHGAIRKLQDLSLVGYRYIHATSKPALHIHDLVQWMIQEKAKTDGQESIWLEHVVALVCGLFQNVEDTASPNYWAECEMLSPHIQNLMVQHDPHVVNSLDLAHANTRVADYLSSRGRYNEAEMLYDKVLNNQAQVLVPTHRDHIKTMERLANNHILQTKYDTAGRILRHVLAVNERELGPNHLETLQNVHNLADVCMRAGSHSEAEQLSERVLKGRVDLLGPNHVNTLATLQVIAGIHYAKGDHDKSSVLYERVLLKLEEALGSDRPVSPLVCGS